MPPRNLPLPSEDEFKDWLAHPFTQHYREFLRLWQENIKDQWAGGSFQGQTPNITFSANAQALGQVILLGQLQEVDYEKFFGVMKND